MFISALNFQRMAYLHSVNQTLKKPLFAKISKLLLLAVCLNDTAFAQEETPAPKRSNFLMRQVNRIFNDTAADHQPSLTYYPSFAYAPETGIELGASILKLFRAKKDPANRLSEIQAFAFFTFNSQYGLWIDNAIYGDKDKWFFLGRTRLQRFPLFYYGIGSETKPHNYAVVDANNIIFRQRILRKVKPNFFIGPEVDFQLLSDVNFKQPDQDPHVLPTGSNGSTNLGLGVAVVYDNRHNVLNVRQGLFAELAFLQYSPGWGSKYKFNSINADLRSFHRVSQRNVFAWQMYATFLHGEVPFNQMALMGGDMGMRGYYQGRFRDKNLVGTQAEFRMLPLSFSKRIGAAVFGGAAVVAPKLNHIHARNMRYSGGIGLRYLLFPKKDIYLRFDLGFTTEGSSFYIYSGEAF